jgi:hypothetical protein
MFHLHSSDGCAVHVNALLSATVAMLRSDRSNCHCCKEAYVLGHTQKLRRDIGVRMGKTGNVQDVQTVTQPMAYLESVSWTPHFKEIVASTIPGLKPPQTSFYGGISRILCIQIIHIHCKSFRPTFSALWTGYQLAHCKTCSLT